MRESDRPPVASLLATGVWLALLAGFAEVGFLVVRLVNDQFIHRSRDFVWMTPAGYLLLFAIPLLALALLHRTTRFPYRASLFVLASMSAGSVLLVFVGRALHLAALGLIAIGIGIQAARLGTDHSIGFQRLIRGTLPWMLGLLLAGWAGTTVQQVYTQRKALARLAQPRQGATNVLLIILDTVRAASLSLYGYSRNTTPELERWSQRGTVFDHAISTAPWTLPSHASLFTGRMPHELSADWLTPLDDRWPTLAETLQQQGYRTGGFVANLIYATWEHGLDRGFQHYEDYPFSLGMLIRHTQPGRRITDIRVIRKFVGTDELIGRKSAQRIGGDFLAWLDRDRARPFFAFLNYYDAHDPYLPPEEYFRKMAGYDRPNKLSPLRRTGAFVRTEQLSQDDLTLEIAGYDGAIAYLDAELGRLFEALDQRGVLEHTLVIVTSDHGEEFGEHGVFLHGHTLYRQALHVPLLMLGAGLPRGIRVPQTVSLRDLPATVADLLAQGDSFPGASLRRFLARPAGEPAFSEVSRGIRIPERYPAARSDLRSVVTGQLHYIQGKDEAMFDWRSDPAELHDLSQEPQAADSLARLRNLLRESLGEFPGGNAP